MLRWTMAAAWIAALAMGCGDDGAASGGDGGGGGVGGQGYQPVCFEPKSDPAAPTPADVQFEAVGPIGAGERILFNDWLTAPNEILAMNPDGSGESVVMRAFRVWSFAVGRDRQKIAFAAGDPLQVEHFGLTFGDTIQPTFIYDAGCGNVGAVSYGNLNDESHSFGPEDRFLYIARRYDFTAEGSFSGWRIGRVELASSAFEWLTPEELNVFAINPQPLADESAIYYYKLVVGGTRSIVKRSLSNGAEETVREKLGALALSPDQTRLVAPDYNQQGALIALDLASKAETLIAAGSDMTTPTFSPDGTRVAYLRFDAGNSCSDIEVVAVDGSNANAPTIVHDCSASGRFVTELSWVAAE